MKPLAHLNMRVPVDFKERLIDHRIETGVPSTTFVCRLVDAELARYERAKKAKRARRRRAQDPVAAR